MKRIILLSFMFIFFMFSAAKAASLEVVDVTASMYEGQQAIAVIFSEPVDAKSDYSKLITLDEEKGSSVKVQGILDKSLQIIYLLGVKPDRSYKVDIASGLKAVSGNKTASTKSFRVTMGGLSTFARFASPGMLMIPSDKAVLPVTVSNVGDVLINFYQIDVDESFKKYFFYNAANSDEYTYNLNYNLRNTNMVTSRSYNLSGLGKQLDTNIEIPKELFERPGVYAAVIQYATADYEKLPTTYFIVSDIGLQIRQYNGQGSFEVWARSLTTGEPLEGLWMNMIYDGESHSDGTQTNREGFAWFSQTKSYQPRYIFVEGKKNQYAFMSISRPMDLSDFSIAGSHHEQYKVFVYGPRDLYRGGEEIKYNILVRNYDGRSISAGSAKIVLTNPQGAEVENINVSLKQDYGYYSYSHQLPANAPTGQWNLSVYVGSDFNTSHNFSVEDFMPETMRLTVGNPAEPLIVPKSTAKTVKVQGDYLYGAPAAGNELEINYNVRPGVYISDKWRNYSFGIDKPESRSMNNHLDRIKLNDRGYFERTLPSEAFSLEEKLSPVRVEYFATLYESGGRAINRAREYVYLPTGEALGIRPRFSEYASTTTANTFSLVNINESEEAIGAKVSVTLLKENRNYYWNYDANKGWESGYTSVFYSLESQEVDLKNGQADVSFKTDYGPYALEVKNLSTGQITRYEFYSGSWWYDSGSLNTSPDKLKILFNKPAYKAGDTAKVTITSPYDGKGRVIVESTDGRLFVREITVKNKMAVLDIPVGADWDRHDIYVTAYLARPEKEMEKTQKSLIFGIEHLRLDRENRKINLNVTHPEKVEPDENFEILVKADDPALAGNKVLVTVAVVDQGILSLKAFETPDAWKFFFAKESYAVAIWDNFWQVIHKYTDKMALRYGGDAELAKALSATGGDLARADVKIVSVFTEPVVFDAKGEAKVQLSIPDFNGEVRVMTMAFGKDSYGSAETVMKVAQPVITDLSMPRFLGTGDVTNLTLDLRNMTDANQHLTVNVSVTEPLALSGGKTFSQTVDLAKGEKAVVNIPVEAVGANGMSTINLHVEGYVKPIRRTWRLAVRPAYPAVSETQLIKVEPGENKVFFDKNLNNYVRSSAHLTAEISAEPPMGVKSVVQGLLTYPYGCLEQTTSSTFPLLYATPEVMARYNMVLPDNASRKELVEDGIARLMQKQLSNGGMGYWDAQSYESYWGTVYAAEFLNEAKRLGFNVPDSMLQKLNNRLMQYVRNNFDNSYSGYYDGGNFYRSSVKAYAAYILSKTGALPLSSVREAYRNHATNLLTPLPMMHFAIALKNAGDKTLAAEAYAAAEKMGWLQGANGYYGDYGSLIRNRAWVVSLLNEYDSNIATADIMYELSYDMGLKYWLSTQERLRILAAAISTFQASDVKGNIDGTAVSQKGAYSKEFAYTELDKAISFISESDKPLYIKTDFNAYSRVKPEMFRDNATIERFYYNVEGKPLDISNVRVGDFVVVELRYAVKLRTMDGLVVDLLPAGFELENQNLDNSRKLDSVKRVSYNSGNIIYSEYRDDRFVAAIASQPDRTASVWYIMRAVTPGKYTNPTPYFEDMYRFYVRSIGDVKTDTITVNPR